MTIIRSRRVDMHKTKTNNVKTREVKTSKAKTNKEETTWEKLNRANVHILAKPQICCSLAVFCCILWGSAFPCIKIGYEWLSIASIGSQILFAGYRFFLAGTMVFATACIMERQMIRIRKDSILHVMGIGFLQTTLQYVCFYIGMSYMTGSKGAILTASSVFFTILIAHFIIKAECLTLQKGIGCLVGFAGVILINAGGIGSGFSLMGDGMMLAAAAAYGASSVFLKLIMHRGTPMAITAYQMTFGGVLLIVIGILAGGQIAELDVKSALLLIYMAFISAAAFSLWTILLKYNPVGSIAVFGFSTPIFGTLLSGIFLGENIFTLMNLAALLCVSGGIIMVNRPEAVTGSTAKKEPTTIQ